MENLIYHGDNQLNYCAGCNISYENAAINNKLICDHCGQKLRNKYAGLALSGGGYRAALFHLGSLWRLNDIGWLKRLAEITSVSGGSITAAYLGMRWHDLHFGDDGSADNFHEVIVPPVRALCAKTIDIGSVVKGCLDPFHRPVDYLAEYYRKELFGTKTLQDLPLDTEGPRFTIYAANLQTGVNVRFSRPYLADYHLGKIESPQIQLAVAAAASCALPPILSPMIINFKPEEWQDWGNERPDSTITFNKSKLRRALYLTDGGVYDNLGLERIWDRYATVLVSDAGAPFYISPSSLGLRFSELARALRAVSILANQTRALRKRWLINDLRHSLVRGTYWGIAADIRNYQLEVNCCTPPLLADTQLTKSLSRIRTRLNRFSDAEQERLINWGYALTDAAMRRHVIGETETQGKLPYVTK
jgi:NTE family protein